MSACMLPFLTKPSAPHCSASSLDLFPCPLQFLLYVVCDVSDRLQCVDNILPQLFVACLKDA